MAHEAYRHESDQAYALSLSVVSVRESDLAFCANPGCVFHVSPGHVNVGGNGNWAKAPDGIITGRQRLGTVMLCDQCAARVLRGELTLQRDCAG